jgi:DNA ligase (NAD+)
VITGVFGTRSRDDIKRLIQHHGGRVTGSLSRETSWLLAGSSPGPEKLKKAESLGIPLLSENDFLGMLQQKI